MKKVKIKIKKPLRLFNVTYYFNSLGHEILCDITKYPFTDTYC